MTPGREHVGSEPAVRNTASWLAEARSPGQLCCDRQLLAAGVTGTWPYGVELTASHGQASAYGLSLPIGLHQLGSVDTRYHPGTGTKLASCHILVQSNSWGQVMRIARHRLPSSTAEDKVCL